MDYLSTRGGIEPATFEEAILGGFAPDGGLYVPRDIPQISMEELKLMANMSYPELAGKILRLYIPQSLIPDDDLKELVEKSFISFETKQVTPLVALAEDGLVIQELFHGPTQSFKDIAMGFLINCMDYFLSRKGEKLCLVLATTGDTGPAAAYAAANKNSLHCWPLYPFGMISEEQERQMTTIGAGNVHPVGVTGCKNGGDDLDLVVARLFADKKRRERLRISSVNSINWCRVLVQTVHYFYGYFRQAHHVSDQVSFSVPAGAFGNLYAGTLARAMGLPIKHLICATNINGTLHRIFEQGLFSKRDLRQTVSSAIDIVVPYNFWRFLYFACDADPDQLRAFMDRFDKESEVRFPDELWEKFRTGILSIIVNDQQTLGTMRDVHDRYDGYLLDPHSAVAVAGALNCRGKLDGEEKVICLATAHPAKFPAIVRKALPDGKPAMAHHSVIEKAKSGFQYLATCDYLQLEEALSGDIEKKLKAT